MRATEEVYMADKIRIDPSTRVSDFLDSYPELEDTLIGIAPPFKKLKNPFLRKSVARVATMKHIAAVGGVPLGELIGKLQTATGQMPTDDSFEDEEYYSTRPDWFVAERISVSVNEETLEDPDKMTLVSILERAKDVKKGDIIELVTTFLPAPGIDTLKGKGYSVWTQKGEDDLTRSYFLKNA
jgi:hypothetical protein